MSEKFPIEYQRQDWKEFAACRGLTAESRNRIFFPEKGFNGNEAKEICLGTKKTRSKSAKPPCPVRDECLAYVLSLPFGETVGIWAGLTQNERRVALHDMDRLKSSILHGTNQGYEKERRWKITICDDCREARRIHLKTKREADEAA
jgi:hypothetical protein